MCGSVTVFMERETGNASLISNVFFWPIISLMSFSSEATFWNRMRRKKIAISFYGSGGNRIIEKKGKKLIGR